MRACSFVPAATRMIYDMGLEHHLEAVTFECPSDKPKGVRSVLEGNNYSSREIDCVVGEYAAAGKSLYYVDTQVLRSVDLDVAFTQPVCNLCQIGTSDVEYALGELAQSPRIVPLAPSRLDDVFNDALTIAEALGEPQAGRDYVDAARARLRGVANTLRAYGALTRRMMLLEWLDPIYNCGHWIPDQVCMAGGKDRLSAPAGYSTVTPWERIVQYDPEVLVIAPCGFDLARAGQEVSVMIARFGWDDLQAVRSNRVFLADAEMFTQPSVATLIDGIEVLAALFHPDIFSVPEQLRHRVANINDYVKAPAVSIA